MDLMNIHPTCVMHAKIKVTTSMVKFQEVKDREQEKWSTYAQEIVRSYSRKMYLTIRCSILSQHGNQAVTMLCPMWLYVTLCSSAYSLRQFWDITWATHVSGLHILAWSGWDVLFLLGPPHDCSEKTLVWLHMYYVSFRLMEDFSLRVNVFYPPQPKLQTVKVWKCARV